MMKKNVLTAFVTLSLVALVASAFVLLDPPRTWDSAPTYIIDDGGISSINDGDNGVTAVVNAINSNDAWNGAGAGVVVNAVAGTVNGNNFVLGDGIPMLTFTDPLNVCTGNCLAATFTGFFSDRGDGTVRIDDADIVTNADGFAWTSEGEDPGGVGCDSEIYAEGVQVHEIGHGLGLGHTNVNGATMAPTVSFCNNGPATIEQDDADGILALYGDGGTGGDGGGDGGSCLPKGASCNADSDCCSNKCRGGGPSGSSCR